MTPLAYCRGKFVWAVRATQLESRLYLKELDASSQQLKRH